MERLPLKVIFVCAGNLKQFQNFLRQCHADQTQQSVKYIYADRLENILGTLAQDYLTIGTFWEREDSRAIYDNVRARVFKS